MTQPVIADPLVRVVARIAGLAAVAGGLAVLVALVYRWYARQRVPSGLAILAGLAAVAVYLNTTTALGEVIGGSTDPLGIRTAAFNIVAFLLAGIAATAGVRAGDRLATDVFAVAGARELDAEVSRLVETVGRVIAVELPDADGIEDIDGYDSVPAETKAALAGRTFVFPRRLTVAELREQLVERLRADYGVGHVDVDLAEDGTVEYLALGSRVAGIGPTLPPGSAAVAVRADPAHSASAGDLVQVWTADPPQRVVTAELRGVADDVVTLALDRTDVAALDPDVRYRLVTLPGESVPDREFASLLRAAEETMGTVTVAADGLAGTPVGALDPTVIAVRPAEGSIEAVPSRSRILAPGDTLYVIARPETLRKLDAAAGERPPPAGSDA